jgi:L-rhamnose mutarotase
MQRMGLCIGLKPDVIEQYKELHAAVWPDVLAVITAANIRNYSIFLREPENLLFAYWEYHGTDFAADAAEMGKAPAMQEWWKICDPLQEPLTTRKNGEWWAAMAEVFHLD